MEMNGVTVSGLQQKTEAKKHKNKKTSFSAAAGGTLSGLVAYNVVSIPKSTYSNFAVNKMQALNSGLTADEFKKSYDAMQTAFDASGLRQKGVEIFRATENNADDLTKLFVQEFNANPLSKNVPKFQKEVLATTMADTIIDGKNAAYLTASKKVAVSEKMGLAAFHEMGHAKNANFSKLGRILQKSRGMVALALPILLITLLKDKKEEGEKPEGALDKATDFVKNNAGKLTFAAWLPTLIEEGMATIKGNKMAAKVLDPQMLKKVKASNALGYSTYLLGALLATGGVILAGKVRDKIVDNANKKQQA